MHLALLMVLAASGVNTEPAVSFKQALARAAEGFWPPLGVVEVEGFWAGEYRNMKFFLSGVGVRNRREQVAVDRTTLKKVFHTLNQYGFADMPDQFGGKPRPTHGPEVRALVRVRLGEVEKTVLQIRRGEQSQKFLELVGKLLALSQKLPQGIVPSRWSEALHWILEDRLAPETLTAEVVLETAPKVFTTFSVDGLWFSLAFGDGKVHTGWLPPPRVKELAKLALAFEKFGSPVRFPWERHVNLHVAVLGQGVEVMGMSWAGEPGGEAVNASQVWSSLADEVYSFVKELALTPAGH
ncbi:MAG: hypothetical protein N2447_05685 [Thermoanaerobaculum sp.]|nr:hypothetical protein [Thermoanaerobaculum sp.]